MLWFVIDFKLVIDHLGLRCFFGLIVSGEKKGCKGWGWAGCKTSQRGCGEGWSCRFQAKNKGHGWFQWYRHDPQCGPSHAGQSAGPRVGMGAAGSSHSTLWFSASFVYFLFVFGTVGGLRFGMFFYRSACLVVLDVSFWWYSIYCLEMMWGQTCPLVLFFWLLALLKVESWFVQYFWFPFWPRPEFGTRSRGLFAIRPAWILYAVCWSRGVTSTLSRKMRFWWL